MQDETKKDPARVNLERGLICCAEVAPGPECVDGAVAWVTATLTLYLGRYSAVYTWFNVEHFQIKLCNSGRGKVVHITAEDGLGSMEGGESAPVSLPRFQNSRFL